MGNKEFLCTQCRGIEPQLVATGKSHGFSRVVVGTWGIFSIYYRDDPSKLVFFSVMSGLLSSYEGHLGNLQEAFRKIGTLLEVRHETQGPFPVATSILGFLSIFKKNQASSPF